PEDAIPDFETLVRLRQDIPCAHVNLGLVYTTRIGTTSRMDRLCFRRAIHHYSAAINVDPTYIRAVRCRVDAFVAMREYRNALLDITRCIHMNPMDPSYYMMGNLDMAAFCVRHSAAMNHGRRSAEGASPTQRALVLSFLGQFDEAIRVLAQEARFRPARTSCPATGGSLPQACGNSTSYEGGSSGLLIAAGSFQECLEILKPWGGDKKLVWPKEAAPGALPHRRTVTRRCRTTEKGWSPTLPLWPSTPASLMAFTTAASADDPDEASQRCPGPEPGASHQQPAMYQVYLSRAAHYACEGRYSKAVLNCNEALRLQPQCVRALLYRGAPSSAESERTGLAVDDLTRAIAVDPTCALAYFNRAVCHGESRQPDLALRDYGVVLMLTNRRLRYRTLVNRGLLYLTSCSDPENALGDFLLAARDRPNDERLLHAIGTCYHRLRRLPQAVRAFSRALDANSNFYDAYIGRANCYLDFGSPRSVLFARRDYERVLMSDPRHLAARVNLAFSLQMDGRMRAAWDQLSAAIRFQPDSPKPWECRAVVSLQMSNLDGALADANEAQRSTIRRCATTTPASGSIPPTKVLTNRALTRGLLGDVDGALADASRAIELSPHMAHAFFNRGKLAVRAGNFDSAEADFSAG
uniref:TPR_REGION domain-containing protein n=1 Tax=Macrostomum lignano TaxID=282301 RepID=A0A1I8F7H0_9PLAT